MTSSRLSWIYELNCSLTDMVVIVNQIWIFKMYVVMEFRVDYN